MYAIMDFMISKSSKEWVSHKLCTCQSLRRSVRLVLRGGSRDGETASYPRRNRLRSSQTTTDQAGRIQLRSESVTDTVNWKQA
jgi:hypothetical protein